MTRSERVVDIDGVSLCLDISGPPDAPVLLLAHGAACSLDAWPDELVDRLARERRVIRFDWRDTGRSTTWPVGRPGYGLPDLADDLMRVLDAEEVARAHLVGLSMGGSAAQLAALRHPGRVLTLTLMSCTPGAPGREADDLPGPDQEAFASGPPEPDWSDPAEAVAYLVESERAYQRGGFEADVQRAVAERTVARSSDLRARENHYAVDGGPGWRGRLGEIGAPTLVVHGADDPVFPLPHAEALAVEVPGASLLVVRDAGHGAPPRRAWPQLVERLLEHTSR
ncbi:alpha/beta fold hydrolase [Cellulomonas cellasea]|uniref:alpha/beta fold hydrolase n=1 Tax=Cellulomonas cellasea TaxID=43670 RepID=UPI0025A3CE97|nr:alpha/beta fold hydrolase [Cellulomonas cellasea]MDM8086024.1 alpha/beta fold hydrolase [Cellulomonas cellasea]